MWCWVSIVLSGSEVGRSVCRPSSFVSHELWGKEDRIETQLSGTPQSEEGAWRNLLGGPLTDEKNRQLLQGKAEHSTEETEAERRSSTHSSPGKSMEIISDCMGEYFSFGKRNDKLRKHEKVYLLTPHKWQLSVQIYLKSDRDLRGWATVNSRSVFVCYCVTSEQASTVFMLSKG